MTIIAHLGSASRYLIGSVAVTALALTSAVVPASAAPNPSTIGSTQAATAVSPANSSLCVNGVCIAVVGTGLFVKTATVTNKSVPAGFGSVLNRDAGVTHTSPNKLSPGQHFTVTFNRDVNNNDQICGEISTEVTVPCVTVHS